MKPFLFLTLLIPLFTFSQNTLSGTFSPAKDFSYAFLYKATPEGASYMNRGQLDSLGRFEIKLDSTYMPGIYKVVYAVPPEENNFDIIYNGKESISFKFSKGKGVEFTNSEENKLRDSYIKSMEMVNITISNYFASEQSDEKGFKAIFKTLKDTQLGYEELAKNKLVSTFITANRPYIPKEFQGVTLYLQSLKSSYFTNIDFSNTLLQSSTYLTERVLTYVFNMIENPNNTTYKSLVSDVANAISDEDIRIKTSLLQVLWQRFVSMNNHEVANYLGDTYLFELANKTNNKVLAQTIQSYKNTSLGAKAPNFKIEDTTKTTSLHDLKGYDNYLLIFWSSGCGHCLNSLPKIKDLIKDKPNIKVVAYGLEKDASNWAQEIKKYPEFIHQLGLDKWKNPMVNTYGIAGTPTYFLLNSSKIITAKPYDFEDLKVVINSL